MKEIKTGTRKLQRAKRSFVLRMPVVAVRTLDLHEDTMFVPLTDDGAIRIYERVERGDFYREGISSLTVEELGDMPDETYKEVVRHHVDDLSHDVLEDGEHPTTGPRWYDRIKDYVEYVNSYWGLLVFILDRLCGK